jgi:hypothetical protein
MSTSPWHQLCTLREDVRTGKLTLDEFAADLNGVRTGDAPAVYRDPAMFFARTYPTFRMKELARDVLVRLAGQGGKPVLQLQVSYGGGKTHTLITLLQLAEHGAQFTKGDGPNEATVREFLAFAGLTEVPRARVALLPFDKFDVIEGLEVHGPTSGSRRQVKTPWGALAYQLAGDVGFSRLKAHDEDFAVPAEPLLVDLLRAPVKEGLGALILVDEAVWYYRNLVLSNQRYFGAMKDFYQVLTQAVAKVDRASLVAALVASPVEANDLTGTQCLQVLGDIFGRVAEPVEPVTREDVSEILRRRLFERVPGQAERQPVIDAMMAAMSQLPLRDNQRDQEAYDRLLQSYPFHPDLIEVLYQKWTQMGRFQRTRGALRLLAYALRDTEGRDPSPMVGPAALLPSREHEEARLSPALNELVQVCEERERWAPILSGELEKAREVQSAIPTLTQREVESAVVATFLHSQPSGQRCQPSELFALLAHPNIDPAAIEEGLRRWRQASWFLVENPEVWQLGTTPNLTRMHVQAMAQLDESDVDQELRQRIQRVPALSSADPGVMVHALPLRPSEVSDDLQLHYLILGPEGAVELGKPLPMTVEAYFNEITGPQNPRTYRNNVLALAPETSRLAGLHEQVRRWLGWIRIKSGEAYPLLTEIQRKDLPRRQKDAAQGLPEAVVAAYNVMVAVDEAGQVQAQSLRADGAVSGTPFERMKVMLAEDERLLTTTLDPELILPGSYLEIWHEGETSRRVIDLMSAFGQFPRLPRLLRPEALYETLARGVREGILILRLPRADGSLRTWWRNPPDTETLKRHELEVQPASLAELHTLDLAFFSKDRLADVDRNLPLTFGQFQALFDGKSAPKLANPEILTDALRQAIYQGLMMAVLGEQAFYREALPEALSLDMTFMAAPAPVRGADLTAQALPGSWSVGETTAVRLASALTAKLGYPVPWQLLSEGIQNALDLGLFRHDEMGGPWPCSPAVADATRFCVVENVALTPQMVVAALDYETGLAPTLRSLKERIETKFTGQSVADAQLIEAVAQAVGLGNAALVDYTGDLRKASNPMAIRVARPRRALIAETTLSPADIQQLAESFERLLVISPELAFTLRATLVAEGEAPRSDVLAQLNQILEAVQPGFRLK